MSWTFSPEEYRRQVQLYGRDAVEASIEQWRIGNSELPYRLARAFRAQFDAELQLLDPEGSSDAKAPR